MIPVVLHENIQFSGNTILVNMSSKEGAYGSWYRSDAHAAYAQQKIIGFFGTYCDAHGLDTRFDGSVLYASCYAGQVELVQWLVDRFGQYEITSWGECVKIDESWIHVRTHLRAQGFEASLVIVDNPRSKQAGRSANEEIICVLLSRMIHGMIALQNHSLLEGQNINQRAPSHASGF